MSEREGGVHVEAHRKRRDLPPSTPPSALIGRPRNDRDNAKPTVTRAKEKLLARRTSLAETSAGAARPRVKPMSRER